MPLLRVFTVIHYIMCATRMATGPSILVVFDFEHQADRCARKGKFLSEIMCRTWLQDVQCARATSSFEKLELISSSVRPSKKHKSISSRPRKRWLGQIGAAATFCDTSQIKSRIRGPGDRGLSPNPMIPIGRCRSRSL